MKKLILSTTGQSLEEYLAIDRQTWKRYSRLGWSRRMLKFAKAAKHEGDIAFWQAVARANDYNGEAMWKQPKEERAGT